MIKNKVFIFLIYPFYFVYAFLVSLRNFFYSAGILKSKKLNKFVISIGNLTVGGTGKTPFTIYICEKLIDEFGLKPCVLSRGYKRVNEKKSLVVEEDCTFVDCGDEPILIKSRLKDKACVLVGKNRYKTANLFKDKCDCDCFVLDDGYQHRKLHRDLDICLIDCSNPFGNGKLFPLGYLRESIFEIKRADIVVLTRSKYAKNLSLLRKTIEELNSRAEIVEANLEVSHFYQPKTDRIIALEDMQEKRVIAFAGIGNPLSFKADLVTNGLIVEKAYSFQDHVVPSPEKLEKLNAEASELNVDFVVTTEKDWVKLKNEKALEIFGEKLIICISNLFLNREKHFIKFMEESLNDKRGS